VVNSLINPTALTKSNTAIKKVFSDRLMIPFLGLGMARSLILTAVGILNHVHTFRYPVMVFHGEKDSVTNIEDSKRFI
jgi:acylglycerol lipase